MSSQISSRKPSPWWLLAPAILAATLTHMTGVVFFSLYGDFLCRRTESGLLDECTPSTLNPHSKRIHNVFMAQRLFTLILSWLARYWFSSLSDRYGRTRVLALANTCLVLASLPVVFIQLVVTRRAESLYWLVIPCAFVQSALKGMATGVDTLVTQAYLIDTTTEITRSSILSFSLGLEYLKPFALPYLSIGFAFQWWKQPIRSLCILLPAQVAYTIYVLRVVPDSLTKDDKDRAQNSYRRGRGAEKLNILQTIKAFASLINPLALLRPTTTNILGAPLGRGRKDWSLVLFVLGLSLPISAVHRFEDRFFFFLSYLWPYEGPTPLHWAHAAQAFALLVFLPVIKNGLGLCRINASHGSAQEGFYSIRQDLKIGRIFLGLLFTSFITVPLVCPNRTTVIALSTALGIPGIIFKPALISVIVSTYARQGGKEAGRLLCGVAVIGEICKYIGTRAFSLLRCPPKSVIIPAVILAASYYCLFRARVPEVHPTAEDESEKQERLVEKN